MNCSPSFERHCYPIFQAEPTLVPLSIASWFQSPQNGKDRKDNPKDDYKVWRVKMRMLDLLVLVQEPRKVMDSFQREVRGFWRAQPPSLGSARIVTRMIRISPYKARCILPLTKESITVTLHQYAPRRSFAFDSLDKLSLHNISEGAGAIGTVELPGATRVAYRSCLPSNSTFTYTYWGRNNVLFERKHQSVVLAYYYHQSWYPLKSYQDAISYSTACLLVD